MTRALTMAVPLLELARRGEKIQTLRRWKGRYAQWEPGDQLLLHAYGRVDPVSTTVESVDRIRSDQLSWEDALYDGLDSLAELQIALTAYDITGPLARIRFSPPG